jgi:PHD/YefM family antitoxin component YafN of YafNO toxin-antitoxin module
MARAATTAECAALEAAKATARRGRPAFVREKGRRAFVLLTARRFRSLLERLEDLEDAADADRAIREFEASGEKAIPWEQVKRELGLA